MMEKFASMITVQGFCFLMGEFQPAAANYVESCWEYLVMNFLQAEIELLESRQDSTGLTDLKNKRDLDSIRFQNG